MRANTGDIAKAQRDNLATYSLEDLRDIRACSHLWIRPFHPPGDCHAGGGGGLGCLGQLA
ncbi:hypothetical protein [Arthrobacter sp. StoSoilB13]|uniref:hypothetical protein n=1 Tax=Arthrobacter sp. StoSoilB13 TaxID=2830993 RepID=UPI001CC3E61F|nr:hypothetical protein [Arthrobacter sp. StoSoilB13]